MSDFKKWLNSIPEEERGGLKTLMIICIAIMIFALVIKLVDLVL